MPVLVVVEIQGGSDELDEALTAAWDLTSSPPEGNRLRLSGPMVDGWRVISLWDSRQQFERFLRERLHMSLEDAGGQEPTITFWDVDKVHRFDG
jgi:hypothetical protein